MAAEFLLRKRDKLTGSIDPVRERYLQGERLREECGVFGVSGVEQAAELVFFGLYSLQHRGQESAGIVSSDGKCVYAHKGLGLVSDVLTADALKGLPGQLAIGHNRYSTTGRTTLENAQPLVVTYQGGRLAIAHNGNLVNARELKAKMETQGSIFQTTMDSEVIVHLVARSEAATLEEKLTDALSQLKGAYALIVMTETKLIGVSDPFGFRPLSIGRLGSGHCLASETCAFDIIGGTYVRPVEAGEMVVVEGGGMRNLDALGGTRKAHCIFELIYFSRPDSMVFSESVDRVRRNLGRTLAGEAPADADIVIAVPDSSNSAALGFAEGSGLPFELGLIRNHYVGRTFIDPIQHVRDQAVKAKFNPVREILSGKKVVVVDDSIVRGTTSRKLIRLIRNAGAKAVHFRVGSPPIQNPCFYGIDTPSKGELIASSHTVEEIAQFLGVDSLAYLSMRGLRSCVRRPDDFCYACFNGSYPVPVEARGDKLALERDSVRTPGDGSPAAEARDSGCPQETRGDGLLP
ncbi:MAG: amidophosphoribosyltransferase [Candidatus Eisenbacteria bacterium]|nr:amidophosphoribosyltransferase [Candidatus Eisenbacteria bacterium]